MILGCYVGLTIVDNGFMVHSSLTSLLQSAVSTKSSTAIINQCHNLPERMRSYSQAVYENSEEASLAVVSKQEQFPPALTTEYILRVLQNKMVALVGDSTLYYTIRWLDALLPPSSLQEKQQPETSTTEQVINRLLTGSTTNLSQTVDSFLDHYGIDFLYNQIQSTDLVRTYSRRHDLLEDSRYPYYIRVQWLGYNGVTIRDNCLFEDQIWPKLEDLNADIVIANWGMHSMFRSGNAVKLCNMLQWLHMEDWMQKVMDIVAVAAGSNTNKPKLVLFKTTNLMGCITEKGEVLDDDAEQQQQERKTLVQSQCHQTVQFWIQNDITSRNDITPRDIDNYCDNGLMDFEQSSLHLNRRITDFVHSKQQQQSSLDGNTTSNNRVRVGLYNDHDTVSCEQATQPLGGRNTQNFYGDGRHYHRLQLPRIRLLLHSIESCMPNKPPHHHHHHP